MRTRSIVAAALFGVAMTCAPALAQNYPTKPITLVVPFPAGGGNDALARLVAEKMSRALGQQVVVENRGGAGGTIGTGLVAKADPDGYSILIQASAHSAAPAAYPNITYDVAKDFVAIIPFGTVPNVTVVAPNSGIKKLKDLVAKAKAGSVTYGSAGVGSATHWAAERIRVAGGFTGIHVPFRGGPEALTEVMTGRVDFTSMGMSSALPLIRDGKLVALAVSTPTRSKTLPDVPTTIEAGLPADSVYPFFSGVYLPAKTPRDVVEKLHGEIAKALAAPAVLERLATLGVEPMPLSQAQFAAFVRDDVAANIALVKAAKIPTQ